MPHSFRPSLAAVYTPSSSLFIENKTTKPGSSSLSKLLFVFKFFYKVYSNLSFFEYFSGLTPSYQLLFVPKISLSPLISPKIFLSLLLSALSLLCSLFSLCSLLFGVFCLKHENFSLSSEIFLGFSVVKHENFLAWAWADSVVDSVGGLIQWVG